MQLASQAFAAVASFLAPAFAESCGFQAGDAPPRSAGKASATEVDSAGGTPVAAAPRQVAPRRHARPITLLGEFSAVACSTLSAVYFADAEALPGLR